MDNEYLYELYKSYTRKDLEECLEYSKTKDEANFYSKLLDFYLEHNEKQ